MVASFLGATGAARVSSAIVLLLMPWTLPFFSPPILIAVSCLFIIMAILLRKNDACSSSTSVCRYPIYRLAHVLLNLYIGSSRRCGCPPRSNVLVETLGFGTRALRQQQEMPRVAASPHRVVEKVYHGMSASSARRSPRARFKGSEKSSWPRAKRR